MRVALFCESYAIGVNGVATAVSILAQELRSEGCDVTIITPSVPGLPDDPNLLRLPALRLPLGIIPYPITNLFAWFTIRKMLTDLEIDIIHANLFFLTGWLALWLGKQKNIPVVTTCHSLYAQNVNYLPRLLRPFASCVVSQIVRANFSRVDAVIAPSQTAATYARQERARRVEVIPSYVPLPDVSKRSAEAQQLIREKLSLPKGAPLLLYVGRLAPEKNVDLMLQGFGLLEDSTAHMVIAGRGSRLPELQKIAQEQPNCARIHFVGQLLPSRLPALYATATVLVLPSRYETQGLVVQEAQSCGLPAIVSSDGGAKESVEDGVNGLIVAPDPAELALGFARFIHETNWRDKLATACQALAETRTPAVTADHVLKLYRSLR